MRSGNSLMQITEQIGSKSLQKPPFSKILKGYVNACSMDHYEKECDILTGKISGFVSYSPKGNKVLAKRSEIAKKYGPEGLRQHDYGDMTDQEILNKALDSCFDTFVYDLSACSDREAIDRWDFESVSLIDAVQLIMRCDGSILMEALYNEIAG